MLALRLNTSEKTEMFYIRRFCCTLWNFASDLGPSKTFLSRVVGVREKPEIRKSGNPNVELDARSSCGDLRVFYVAVIRVQHSLSTQGPIPDHPSRWR